MKLLLQLYDPDSGVIRINGADIKEYRLSEQRANFSVYFQEMHNYCFALRDNLTIADDSRANVDEAARAALIDSYCKDILKNAEKGLDTSLTRFFEVDGIELSGGQHQNLRWPEHFFTGVRAMPVLSTQEFHISLLQTQFATTWETFCEPI